MKTSLKIISFVFIVAIAACSTQNKIAVTQQDIVGTWLLKGRGTGYPASTTLITNLIINADNTYSLVHGGTYNKTVTGPYTIKNNELKLFARDGYNETYQIVSLKNNQMHVNSRQTVGGTRASNIEQILYEKVAE